MLRVFKTSDDGTLEKLKNIETNTWIDLVEPTEEEIKEVVEKTDIPANLLIKLLDSDEVARIEKEDDATLIIIDVPYVIDKKIKNKYSTLPLGIISYKNYLVTIAVKETEVVQDVMENRVKSVFTMKKSRFLIQILHRVATLYLKYLKEINLEIEAKEKNLINATNNKYLLQLMNIQKSLVYFVTSLKSNDIILEKLEKGNLIEFYEEDMDVLEDAIIENRQGIETSLIYREIVASLQETYSGVISNNLNEIMKFLAGITIVFSIPTMIASFMGMNVPLGHLANNDYSFMFIMSISIFSAFVIALILKKKDML
ncbi:MAG: magnesium transporter CorA family protein [Bacilli bacterium]|nr:magnesium transporter CorA family protein [Bacilli bacterium]MDY3801764.1 magnesium transporter CorA family protein [Bacilli bacterium]